VGSYLLCVFRIKHFHVGSYLRLITLIFKISILSLFTVSPYFVTYFILLQAYKNVILGISIDVAKLTDVIKRQTGTEL